MSLWDWRLDVARKEPKIHGEEMRAFGWWFARAGFDDEWSIDNLHAALQLKAGVEVEHQVAERLAKLAPGWPTLAVTCLRFMIASDIEGWAIYGWRESARSILAIALESAEPEARDLADRVIQDLGARGHFDYRDISSPDE